MPSSTAGSTQDKMPSKVPDLSSILDKIDFSRKPLSHSEAGSQGHFSVTKWGALIIELVAYPTEQNAILETFGLTPYQLSELMGNPLFQAMYKDTESSIQALASNGGFQLSARRVAEQGLVALEKVIAYGEDKDRIKAAELVARLSGLDPIVQAKTQKESATINTGVQLVVNFSNQLPVPDAFKGQGQVVIDTTAEETSED